MGQFFEDGFGGRATRKSHQRLTARIERLFDDEADVAHDLVDQVFDRIKFPILDFFGHDLLR